MLYNIHNRFLNITEDYPVKTIAIAVICLCVLCAFYYCYVARYSWLISKTMGQPEYKRIFHLLYSSDSFRRALLCFHVANIAVWGGDVLMLSQLSFVIVAIPLLGFVIWAYTIETMFRYYIWKHYVSRDSKPHSLS